MISRIISTLQVQIPLKSGLYGSCTRCAPSLVPGDVIIDVSPYLSERRRSDCGDPPRCRRWPVIRTSVCDNMAAVATVVARRSGPAGRPDGSVLVTCSSSSSSSPPTVLFRRRTPAPLIISGTISPIDHTRNLFLSPDERRRADGGGWRWCPPPD